MSRSERDDEGGRISRARPGRGLLAAGALMLLGACSGPREKSSNIRWLDMRSIQPELEFTARVRDQESKSKVGAGDQSSHEEIFEEIFRLKTKGSVYHPNLLDFSLAGAFGLTQQSWEEVNDTRARSFDEDGNLLEFDFDGELFKKKRYPGNVYARRYRALQPRAFLSSIENTTDVQGFAWKWVDPKMPTSLQFNHTTVRLDPLDPDEREGEQENTNLLFDTAYRFTDHNVLSFNYTHQSVSEKPFATDYYSDEATLAHRLDFGERHRHRLESEINYFDQHGSFQNRRTRWREILRLKHTEDLRSWYQFELQDRKQGGLDNIDPIEERSYFLSGTFEHEWYDSVDSQLYGFGQRQDFASGLKIERLGLLPSVNYRKKNRWGSLLAGYRARFQSDDRTGAGFSNEVRDEPRTFRDPEPILLQNTNVVISSIFITAEDRTTLYQSERDYRVRRVGDQVEIERIPTGRITDGQTVLIDYVFEVGGDFKLETVGHDFDVRQNFSFGLSPYYRFRKQDQSIAPANSTGVVAENITAHLVGAEFNRGPFRAVAEYEDFDSNINPFSALRLTAEVSRQFRTGGTGRVQARWTDIQRFGDTQRQIRFFTVEGRVRQAIRRDLSVEAAVLHRIEDDSLSGKDRGTDFDFSLEWRVRQTELRVTYEYGRFEDDFAENRNQALFVQFRRRF